MKRSFGFSYLIALVAVLIVTLFIVSCNGGDGDTTQTPSVPGQTTTAATVGTNATTTATDKASSTTKKPDPDGAGWITDKNGNPAYY